MTSFTHRLAPDEALSAGFNTTHWSVVAVAGRDDPAGAAAALERLCRTYWYPIYAFIRRRGSGHHEAEDSTQAFFAFLLGNETIRKADRQKGRFRTFLLAALTNFLTNEWDKRQTWKRGGRQQIIPLDEAIAENLYRQEPAGSLTPESLFERRWVLTLVEQALAGLRLESGTGDKAALFARLEPALTVEVPPGFHVECAAALGMSEGAVKVALHRLRRRFGELLRNEIARTVASPTEVDEELRHLLAAISNG